MTMAHTAAVADADAGAPGLPNVMLIGDPPQARALRQGAAAEAFHLLAVSEREGLGRMSRQPPDLVLLPLVGDGSSGLALLQRVRSISDVGIITLGSSDLVQERIQALDAGADDHLSRPIDDRELTARMRAVLRRTRPPAGPLTFDVDGRPLTIDLVRKQVSRDGHRIHLTGTELRLLELLVSNPGRLLSHRELLRQIWGEHYGTESNYLRVYVAQLRKKLGDRANAPRLIETAPGVGYRWIGT